MDIALRPKDPIAPQLLAQLRQAIAGMHLPPGAALSEKEIAARFGVSRQPVREAFIKLSEAGLVEVLPSRGTFVSKISVREVANARFVREALESDIARHAARMAVPGDIDLLKQLVDQQDDAASAGDYTRFNELDEAFHRAIAEIVQSDYAWRILEAARFQTDRVRLLSLPDASPLGVLIGQHREIVAGLEARDGETAAQAMRRHLREILVALTRIAADHPDYFSDTGLPAHAEGLLPG